MVARRKLLLDRPAWRECRSETERLTFCFHARLCFRLGQMRVGEMQLNFGNWRRKEKRTAGPRDLPTTDLTTTLIKSRPRGPVQLPNLIDVIILRLHWLQSVCALWLSSGWRGNVRALTMCTALCGGMPVWCSAMSLRLP